MTIYPIFCISFSNQIKSFIILAILRRSVKRVCGAHLRVIGPGQHSSFWRNVAAVASRWQHCVRFDRPEIWTSDLPLQRRTRYRSTSWPVHFFFITLKCIVHTVHLESIEWIACTHLHEDLHWRSKEAQSDIGLTPSDFGWTENFWKSPYLWGCALVSLFALGTSSVKTVKCWQTSSITWIKDWSCIFVNKNTVLSMLKCFAEKYEKKFDHLINT